MPVCAAIDDMLLSQQSCCLSTSSVDCHSTGLKCHRRGCPKHDSSYNSYNATYVTCHARRFDSKETLIKMCLKWVASAETMYKDKLPTAANR